VHNPPTKIEQHWLILRIDEERKQQRISARKFSGRLGYSPTFWTGFVQNQEHPVLTTLCNALELLGLELQVVERDTHS
jgi:transcriptional regulator with XRE-family HTH domain